MPKKKKRKELEYAAGAVGAMLEAEDEASEVEAPEADPAPTSAELTAQEIIADAMEAEELALWAETEKLLRFSVKPLLRMSKWAFAHRRSRLAINIATFNWGLSAGNMSRAVVRHMEYFDGTVHPSATDLRMLFVLGQLNPADDKRFYDKWRKNQSMMPWEMQRLVTAHRRKNAKAKPKKIRAKGQAIHKSKALGVASVEIVTEEREAFEDVVEGAHYNVLFAPDNGDKKNGKK